MEITLGEIVELINGKAIKAGGEGKYPVYGSNGIIGYADKYIHDNGLIIGRVGAYCGSVEYCENKFWASDNTIVAKPKKDISSARYVYYLLKNAHLNDFAGGAAQPLLTQRVIKNIEFDIPPHKAQKKIAKILSNYDKLIENNSHRTEILVQIAKAIYQEWFEEYHFPGHEDVPMVDSELGNIPKGWEVIDLGQAMNLEYGKGLRKKDRINGTFPVYGSSGIIDWHNEALVKGPGIILGRKGNVGSIFWEERGFYPIDTVYYVVSDISYRYIYFYLLNQNFISSDTAVPGLNRNYAYSIPFLLPDEDTLTKFSQIVTNIFDLSTSLENKNSVLSVLRDLLIPKLLNGDIEVEI